MRNAAALSADTESIVHLYRRLLACRRASPALQDGDWRLLDGPDGVLAYERASGPDVRQVWANFEDGAVRCPAAGDWVVEVSTLGRAEGDGWDGRLEGTEAVVVRPPNG